MIVEGFLMSIKRGGRSGVGLIYVHVYLWQSHSGEAGDALWGTHFGLRSGVGLILQVLKARIDTF